MFNKNFYPTPDNLIKKMVSKLKLGLRSYSTILEPSAGKGNIVDYLVDKMDTSFDGINRASQIAKIDTIEKSEELQATLKGKEYKVIHDDFLTFETYQRYELIIMNPPFSEGDKHLLKAIDIQKRGGEIVCLLNAETLKNPYSNIRKHLINLLDEYNAEIEYLEGEFENAERKTNVEIALVYIDIQNNYKDDLILNNLKNKKREDNFEFTQDNKIISANPIEANIQNFNLEIELGLKMIYNYFNLKPIFSRSLREEESPILNLVVAGEKYTYNTDISIINRFIREVRYKYWTALIDMNKFRQLLTSDLKSQLQGKLNELRDYDFTQYNINQVIQSIMVNLNKSIDTTIIGLFEDFTNRYNYDRYSSNIHLFNGWKTNIGYKINDKKVIIPLSAYDQRWNPDTVRFGYFEEEKIRDMQKALEYLEGGKTKGYDNIREILQQAQDENNDEVEFKYFTIKFYKKGTAHITWKDKDLIKKLNLYGAKHKKWLPYSYGEEPYEDLSTEEKRVVDEFEGKQSYKDTFKKKHYYLATTNINQLLL